MFWKKNKIEKTADSNTRMLWRGIALTDVGMVRENNEDAVFLAARYGRYEMPLAIVCDGMGGHSAGEIASQHCIKFLCRELENSWPEHLGLSKLLQRSNENLFREAQVNTALSGMGTTCSFLIVKKNKVAWAHVGDSHIYKYEDGILSLLNDDHTLEFEKRKNKLPVLPGDEHVLTMAVGTRGEINPQSGELELENNKELRFLLCTDGLYNLISEEELNTLLNIQPASLCAQVMISLVKERGGHDNISLCLLDRIEFKVDNQETISN